MKIVSIMLAGISLAYAGSIDFNSLLDKTLKNDKNLQISDINVKIAYQDVNKKFAQMFGVVNVVENYSNTNNAMYVFSDKLNSRQATFNDFGFGQFIQNQSSPNVTSIAPKNLNNPGTLNNYETAIEYSVPLFNGFAQFNAHEASKINAKAKEQMQAWDKKTVMLNTLKAYNHAVAAKEYAEAAKTIKKASSAILKRVEAFYEQKLVSKASVAEALWFDSKANAAVAEMSENYALAIANLKFITSDYQITDVKDFPNIKFASFDVNKEVVLKTREDLASYSLQEDYMQKLYHVAKGNLSPSINGYAKYSTNNAFPNYNNDYGSYFVGIALKYPIFDGGKDSSEREMARLEWQKSKLASQSAKDEALFNLEKVYLSAKTKQIILEEKQKASDAANDLDEKYALMYENGLTSLSERLKKEATKAEAKAEFINAKALAINAIAEYRIYSGHDLEGK